MKEPWNKWQELKDSHNCIIIQDILSIICIAMFHCLSFSGTHRLTNTSLTWRLATQVGSLSSSWERDGSFTTQQTIWAPSPLLHSLGLGQSPLSKWVQFEEGWRMTLNLVQYVLLVSQWLHKLSGRMVGLLYRGESLLPNFSPDFGTQHLFL